jgi:DNA helicase-2/ATP-dependent DNA helicase PcrA
MATALDALSAAQREVVTHAGPLLVLGGAGTGKTRALVARFSSLIAGGVPPEAVLVIVHSPHAAERLRGQLEDELVGGYEALAVHTAPDFCEHLLREEALEAGIDPFFVPATRADRVAMLLERLDELTLMRHDFRGRPSALIAGFVERIDRLKDELVDPAAYAGWAAEREQAAEAPAPRGEVGRESQERERALARREREFAQLYLDHDRMLAEQGTPDGGEMVMAACALLRERPHVRARVAARYPHILIDDLQDASLAQMSLVDLLAGEPGDVCAAGDEDQTVWRYRAAGSKNLRDFQTRRPAAPVVRLEHSHRCPERLLTAAMAVLAPIPGRESRRVGGQAGGDVRFWRCANERTQAQSVAAEIERLVAREGVAPETIAVLVRSVGAESRPVAAALEERAVPHRVVGATAFFERAEVRDVLAWLRLLVDPRDAGAVVRALARPPIELRSVDLARVIQISRRRKLDMVAALVAATESPQIPPEARERILAFLKLHRSALGALDTTRPDLFVHRLVERLGLRRQQLFAAHTDVVERLVNLAKLGEIAAGFVRRSPQATPREFARYVAAVAESELGEEEAIADARPRAVQVMSMLAVPGQEFDHVFVVGLHAARMPGTRRRELEPIPDALLKEELPPDSRDVHLTEMRRLLHVAMTRARERVVLSFAATSESAAVQPPSPFVEEARAAVGGVWEEREEELFGPAETLQSTLRMMREEVLEGVARIGGRLSELRLDTDLDISHGVVRYLELVKLGALIARPEGQSVAEALPDINARLLAAATSLQREIYETSALDDTLLAAEHDDRARVGAIAARDEPSLEPFLPKRGEGLVLSASDIETYRTCPLKYKFARVFRIPSEPTLNQRFGILIHQVLERYHAHHGESRGELSSLLEAGWRRGGFGDSEQERQLREKARQALAVYHERLQREPAEPVWFERSFSFRMGPHHLRGRVDRIDKLPGEGYELIDYKTGRPKTATQLKQDIQLSLYALGARESWHLEAAQQAYYYVLDDEKVPVPRDEADAEWIRDTVLEVADGILAQGFEPTPSYAACSVCDYRIVCPAAEK